MKKAITLIILMFISGFLFACSLSPSETEHFFIGTIIDITDQSAIVLADDDEEIRSSGAEVAVNLSVNEETEFMVGDKVKVGYDGDVGESYPLHINTIYVELVE